MSDRIVRVRLVVDSSEFEKAMEEARTYFAKHRSKRKRAALLEKFKARIRSFVSVIRL